MSKNLVITITREHGAGGTKIAKAVSKILEMPYYSKEAFFVGPHIEHEHRTIMHRNDIKKIILDNTPCVAVGRCADYVMADKDATYFSVFVKAPNKVRRENLKKEHDLDSHSVDRLMEKEYKMKKHFEHYTGLKWGSSKSFDLVLNTGKMKRDEAIRIICETALGLMNKQIVPDDE